MSQQHNASRAHDLLAKLVRVLEKNYAPEQLDDATKGVMQEATSYLQKPETRSTVPVKYWDAYGDEDTVATHQIDIDDQRAPNGQTFVTISAIDGKEDDMISVTLEVNENPLNEAERVPCVHLHFDDNSLALSLFKIGERILARPETNVDIASFPVRIKGFHECLYWIN